MKICRKDWWFAVLSALLGLYALIAGAKGLFSLEKQMERARKQRTEAIANFTWHCLYERRDVPTCQWLAQRWWDKTHEE